MQLFLCECTVYAVQRERVKGWYLQHNSPHDGGGGLEEVKEPDTLNHKKEGGGLKVELEMWWLIGIAC